MIDCLAGDCLERLRELPSTSLDSLVTDPPAGISFMGKEWDHHKGGRDAWVAWLTEVMQECLRVLKPGAHGLVWALPRTSHWTATALENAGFEVRDVVTHLFGTGFPKSLDISKAIDKAAGIERTEFRPNPHLGTALKPASEHWILVRKPCSEKTVAANVLKWGTGGINIDGCRVDPIGMDPRVGKNISYGDGSGSTKFGQVKSNMICGNVAGRFPANLILDEEAAEMLDEQSAPSGGASRFFYVAKASKSDRGEGNKHPTVKSTKLMAYLIRLVTPAGGTVLDPFMGSGSTGVAAESGGFAFVGIEAESSYFETAKKRIG